MTETPEDSEVERDATFRRSVKNIISIAERDDMWLSFEGEAYTPAEMRTVLETYRTDGKV